MIFHGISSFFHSVKHEFSMSRHVLFTLQELRASNDDRADRDLQLDGGGISDQPVVIAVYPTAQAIR
jgi:hypothetical protein